MGIDEKTMHPNGCKAKPKTAPFLWFRAARTRNSSLQRSVTRAALFSRDEVSRTLLLRSIFAPMQRLRSQMRDKIGLDAIGCAKWPREVLP